MLIGPPQATRKRSLKLFYQLIGEGNIHTHIGPQVAYIIFNIFDRA